MLLFIFEVVLLPVYLLSLKILHKYNLLTEIGFYLITVTYLGVMISTASELFSTILAIRIIGLILTFLCWFQGYSLARSIYRQKLLRSRY